MHYALKFMLISFIVIFFVIAMNKSFEKDGFILFIETKVYKKNKMLSFILRFSIPMR